MDASLWVRLVSTEWSVVWWFLVRAELKGLMVGFCCFGKFRCCLCPTCHSSCWFGLNRLLVAFGVLMTTITNPSPTRLCVCVCETFPVPPLERLFLVIHLKDASFKWICIWLSELLGFKHLDPFSQGQERSKVEWRTGGGMSDSLTVGPKGLGDLAHLNGKLLYLPWHGSVKVTAPPLTG